MNSPLFHLSRLVLVLLGVVLLGSCCDECACNDECKKPYVFRFTVGPGEYAEEEVDTLMVRYKFEGFSVEDTSWFFLVQNRFQPSHPCVGSLELGLDKSIPDTNGMMARVAYYKIHTAVDSFLIDGMDLTVTKSGKKCCRCVTGVERRFQVDSVKIQQTSLAPVVIPLQKKQ